MLCTACEHKTGRWDEYAKKIFVVRYNEWRRCDDWFNPALWRLENCRAEQIKLFSLAVLVRAHYSDQLACEGTNLGPEIGHIKAYCDAGVPDPSRYPLVLKRLSHSKRFPGLELSFVPPTYTSQFRGAPTEMYCFALAGFCFYQVTDSRKFDAVEREISYAGDNTLLAYHENFDDKHLAELLNLVDHFYNES
jgi:hypothetical protein